MVNSDEDIGSAETFASVAEAAEGLLRNALDTGGYCLVDTNEPLQEGQARFVNGHIEVFFRKNRYPENVFVTWPDGSWGFAVFPGKSGAAGNRTLRELPGFPDSGSLGVRDADLGGQWRRCHAAVLGCLARAFE